MRLYEKYLKLYLNFLIFFIPLVFIQKCEDAYYLPKLVLLLSAAWFVPALIKIKFDMIDIVLFAFMGFYALGCIHAIDPWTILYGYCSMAAVVIVFIYARHCLDPVNRKEAFCLMLLSAVTSSFYAVAQAFKLDLKGWITDFAGRTFSSMGNPDFFGGFLVLIIPVSLVLYYFFNKKNLSVTVFMFLSATLLLSQTRSSLAAYIISVALMMFLFRDYFAKNIRVLLIAAAAAVILVLFTGRHADLLSRLKSMGVHNADLQGRLSMWLAGLDMIKHNFLTGAGIGNIKSVYYLYKKPGQYLEADHLHNDFIEMASESGIIALAFFIVFLAAVLRKLLLMNSARGKIVFISACAMIVHACFNFPFYIVDTKFYFFLLLGLGTGGPGVYIQGENEEDGAFPRARIPGPYSLLWFLILPAAFMIIALRSLCGSIYLNYGINAGITGDKNAGQFLERAGGLYPGPKKYYYLADWLLKQKDYSGALQNSGKLLKEMPLSKTGNIQAGIIYAEAGDLGGAINRFDLFLKYYHDDPDVLNDKGKALYMSGNTAGAVGVYKQIILSDQSNELAHNSLYTIYSGKGMKKEAEEEGKRWDGLKAHGPGPKAQGKE
jgi:O-antigen ligase